MIQDILNKTFSGVSIEYLTEMHSEFLNNEDKYDFKYVQKINSRLNILYFLYVYNRKLFDGNLDNISKSYIPSCIKGIINVKIKTQMCLIRSTINNIISDGRF